MIHVSMLDLSSVIECIPLTKPLAEDEVRKTNFTWYFLEDCQSSTCGNIILIPLREECSVIPKLQTLRCFTWTEWVSVSQRPGLHGEQKKVVLVSGFFLGGVWSCGGRLVIVSEERSRKNRGRWEESVFTWEYLNLVSVTLTDRYRKMGLKLGRGDVWR